MRGWVWFYEKKREKIILLFPIERAASVLSRVLDRKSNLQVRESDFLSVKKQYFGFDEKMRVFFPDFPGFPGFETNIARNPGKRKL